MKGLSLYVANHLAAEAASHFYDLKDVRDNSKPEHKNIITLAKIPEPRHENHSSPSNPTNPPNRGR